jgi:lipopolysaccharide heptosyltransferase II
MDSCVWEKILVVQTSFLGDTVLTLPLLSEIKRRFPGSKLSLLCTPTGRDLLLDYPIVDEIIVDEKRGADRGWKGLWRKAKILRTQGFTLALCPHKSFRSGLLLFLARIPRRVGFAQSKSAFLFHVRVKRNAQQHDVERTLSILQGLGIRTEDCDRALDLPIAPSLEEEVTKRLQTAGVDTTKMVVGIHPGSVWATKRWSAEAFGQLIRLLKQKYSCEIVLFGGSDDAEVVDKVQNLSGDCAVSLVNRISLRELPAALSLCNLLITNDSGPMHIAVARNVPVVAIFCATTPELGFYPYSAKAIVVGKKLPCRPCSSHGSRRCPLGTEDCIRLIRAEEVFQAVERLLKTTGQPEPTVANRYIPQWLTI